ncbi:MAG: glycoside hydrolase family 127 protein [Anaerolineae bacterium]|nr:glycoside hydrolase family 127 protein [Anaerolineae bacterium]
MLNLQPFSLGVVQPGGWLRQQLLDDLEHGYAGRLDALTERAANDLFASRITSSQSQFAWWDSETRGNWLWGYVMMAHLANHPAHIARADALLQGLLHTQDDDGYIGIYSPEWRYRHPPGENGERWSQSRALLPLLAYYELTGRHEVLGAVERAAQLTMRHYGEHNRCFQQGSDPHQDLTGLTHGLCYIDVVAWLYRITGDATYREFGVWLFDDFCGMTTPFPNDDMVVKNLLRDRPFSGHAVHTVEHLRALLWAAAVTRRPDLETAAARALFKLRRYMLPNGAVIGDEGIHGFPRPDSGYEYCTITELLLSLTSGLSMSAEAWYGDTAEMLTFNAAQGARLPGGTGITYLTTDTRLAATCAQPDGFGFLHGMAGRFKYSVTHEDVACCCNPNSVRLLPHYISAMWQRAEDGFAAVLYGECIVDTQFNGSPVQITEATDYPFSDTISITLKPETPVKFAVYLRRPGWVNALHVDCDGAEIEKVDAYVKVSKTWRPGDVIHIDMANTVRTIPYLTGEHAVFYGALQFAQPIDHRAQPIKSYPVAGFHDFDIIPESLDQAYRALILDGAQKSLGLALERAPADSLHPWHHTPMTLVADNRRLIPMGCTVLRRAAFPMTQPNSS